MATNDEGSGKGPPKVANEQPGAKKPAAIIDLKPTSVGVEDPKKAAPPSPVAGSGSTTGGPAKPGEVKPAESKAGDDKTGSVPGAGAGGAVPPVAAQSSAGAAAGGKPGLSPASGPDKPGDKPAVKPTIVAGGSAKSGSGTGAGPVAASARPAAASGGLMSGLTHLAAGLAGGLLVMFGADAIGLQRGEGSLTRELEARLAAVETASRSAALPADLTQRLVAAEQRVAVVDQVRQRLGELDQRQNTLVEGTKALEERLAGGANDTTVARVAKLEDTLSTLSRAAGDQQAGRLPQLAAITGRLADLESTVNNQLTQLRKSVLSDVENRVTNANEASEAARTGTQRIDRELASQKAEAARVGQRLDRTEIGVQKAEENANVLRGSIEQLRVELGGVARPKDVAAAVEPVAGRVAKVEQSLQAVEKSEADRRGSVERIVLALELGNLKRVVERGAPFAAELAQVREVGGNRVDLAALERYKDQGVATPATLHREFRDLVHRMLDADRAGDGGGIVDRLLAGAKSIVRVRKTDAAADDTGAEATVARMEAALKEGRLADVAAAAKGLPEASRKVASPWLDRVEAAAAVERAIAGVERELKSALGAAAKRG